MAFPDITIDRLGQVKNTGDDRALFQQQLQAEILAAFDTECVMLNRHNVRTISKGKSASFAATGKADASFHTPGTNLLSSNAANQQPVAERIINIDAILQAYTMFYDLDEAMTTYDVRAEKVRQLSQALANKWDERVLISGVLGARAAALVAGQSGGSVLTAANVGTDGEVLASSIFLAAQTFDEKDVPDNDRFAVLRPAQYSLLAQSTKVLNRDWGGAGVYADGTVFRVSGVEIVKSNHLPITNITTNPTGANNPYNGDFSNTKGLVMNRDAVATVKLMEMKTSLTHKEEYFADLFIAYYAMGTGYLRPDCAIELAVPAA